MKSFMLDDHILVNLKYIAAGQKGILIV